MNISKRQTFLLQYYDNYKMYNYFLTMEQILRAIYLYNVCLRIGWFAVRTNVNKHDSCNSFPFKKDIKNNVLSTVRLVVIDFNENPLMVIKLRLWLILQ